MNCCATILLATIEASALKPGQELHGFRVTELRDLPEVPAKMVRMTYVKNGADLVWLDRAEENKTFAVAFKTVPDSDNGVAHILEHSVLCGSAKYPVKEPFVDLLKSSLATFLNAMTWSDKTAYPVSSRNGQDFLNLMDVYLDAVFHPLSVTNDWALRQEGWHYELETDREGTERLVRNGVVYSEMKGAFADPDTVAYTEMMRRLFPDNTYGVESGGDPAHIPELTPEKYRAFHARFYHPSNARIFLDGRIDLDATLARLDSYLRDFERRAVEADIPLQKPVAAKSRLAYESAETTNRVVLADGWVVGTYADRERILAIDVLSDVLVGSNEAPLKKALLEKGLCEDVGLWISSIQQPVASIFVRNTSEEKAEACRRTVRETLERLCREGLDRKRIAARLDNLEFRTREKDTGTRPRGLAFMNAALGSWIYGGDPADAFSTAALFASLRKKLAEGAFERILREALLTNPHHAEVTLVPSTTLGAERAKAQADELEAILAKMDDAERAKVRNEAKRLKELQRMPNRPEDVAKLPRLKVADIPVEGERVKRTIGSCDGVTVIRPEVASDGIFYLDLCFSLAGLKDAELLNAPLLATVLGELPTERFSALDLQDELTGKLGRCTFDVRSFESGPQLIVHVSALDAHLEDALGLISEVTLGTRYTDRKAIGELLAQSRENLTRDVQNAGNAYAMRRAARGLSCANRTAELLDGIGQLRHLQKQCAATDGHAATAAALQALAKAVFVRSRLTVCATGVAAAEGCVRRCVALYPAVERPKGTSAAPQDGCASEGFEIPAAIGFSATASRLPKGVPYCGSQIVAAKLLSLDYLWNEIRVQGGAYGTRLYVRPSGDVLTMSYRDPNPARSLETFKGLAAALEKFLASGEPFDKYQVAAIADTEPYLTPRREAQRAYELHFSNRTPEDLRRLRREILTTTRKDLEAFARTLKTLESAQRTCVIAGKDILGACRLERTEQVVR